MSNTDQNAINAINAISNQPSTQAAAPGAAGAAAGAAAGGVFTAMEAGLLGGAASMASGGQAMLAQANSGNLKFDPETGQSLLNTLNKQVNDLTSANLDIGRITREPMLGQTPGAKAMAQFNQDVSSTGSKAFVPAHKQFLDTLGTMVQAVQVAMKNYTSTDDDNAQKLKPKD